MGIESPQTYGEYFWSSQFESSKEFAELEEEAIKSFIPSVFADPSIREAVPFDILNKWEALTEFPSPGLAAVARTFVTGVTTSAAQRVLDAPMRKLSWASSEKFPYEHLSPDQYAMLRRRKIIEEDFFAERAKEWGFDAGEQVWLYETSAEYPSTLDLFRMNRFTYGSADFRKNVKELYDVPPKQWPVWDWLSKQHLSTGQYITANVRGEMDGEMFLDVMDRLGWTRETAEWSRKLAYDIPNAMLLVQGDLQHGYLDDYILDDIGHANIHPDYRAKYLDAVLTKPSSSDLIAYNLRTESPSAYLDLSLRKIGIHPEYLGVYQTLSHRLPPVADIISMAVREAFSPEVAVRFGQYEDFPEQFGKYAAQQGLDLEWSQRYWAAHWGLPSPQQGFEMLHRGVITGDDLGMLMKAQDIMPFWRDKMLAIAYRTLTRVDVRRMYELGVLERPAVLKSYLDMGYDAENAENMTAFTEAYVKKAQTHTAPDDIVKAYSNRILDRPAAWNLLMRVGVIPDFATYMLDDIEYKRELDRVDANIKGIKNLYRKGVYTKNQTVAQLAQLDLPGNTIELLMQQWWNERQLTTPKTFSKAETIKFMQSGAITKERGKRELYMMGYDKEHVDVYMGAIEWN